MSAARSPGGPARAPSEGAGAHAKAARPSQSPNRVPSEGAGAPTSKPVYWEDACRELASRDVVLAELVARYPGLHLARRGDPFTTLARAIVGQQISVKAAQSIWDRLLAAASEPEFPARLPASRVARLRMPTLRRVGLSARKSEYLRDLARHFLSGALSPEHWPQLDDEALIERLVEVKGIGRWTAEMFLIFHELRPDVFPVDDLGLQRAVGLHYNRGERMAGGAMRELAASWQPWRSVATWYLWRSLDPIPVEY